ncbi:MAG: HlyD family type I secretion periplasmic adaptor subunit [Geminicoccaceae bacterium]|nr:HlyD family type I secretion periplasmic adaptor subunit [Geminicoccaceae bacterium]MCB9945798.1 HlyD family type I secretion periplasmic adaptor subunit [Geminicoccaceae bacterium]
MSGTERMDEDDRLVVPATARASLERRSSPLASALIGSITLMVGLGIGWMAWADVDEVIDAPGKVEPMGRVKVINHSQGGRIARLHVTEGTFVHAGDPLVTFAPEIALSEQRGTETELDQADAEIARLKAEIEGTDLAFPADLAKRRPDLLDQQRELMEARRESVNSERRSLLESVRARRDGEREIEADTRRLKSGLELLERQLAAVKELTERGLYPKLKALEVERQLVETRGLLERSHASRGSADAAVAERKAELERLERKRQSDLRAELAGATAERDRLREEAAARTSVVEGLELTAPVDGIVEELGLLAEGQSVGANAPLMKLVPVDDNLVIRADVANEDISRIRKGMPVTIKVRAYDFARYGTLEGTVDQIATDASVSEKGQAPSYQVSVLTNTAHVGSDAANAVLPGMLVDIELQVGERSILSYLTDGITRYRQSALKEG